MRPCKYWFCRFDKNLHPRKEGEGHNHMFQSQSGVELVYNTMCRLRCALRSDSADAAAFEPLVEQHRSFRLVQDQGPAVVDIQNEVEWGPQGKIFE